MTTAKLIAPKTSKAKKKTIHKPSKVISSCPHCKCQDLIRLEVDVLCANCDWMSAEAHVETGGMDNMYRAFADHFFDGQLPVHLESDPIIKELAPEEQQIEENLAVSISA